MTDKKDTGSAKRPKRDPNQPTPKAGKRSVGALAIKLALGALVAVLTVWTGMYSVEIERGPWAWTPEDRAGFLTFSRAQVDEARANVESVDWDALKNKLTAKSRELWNDAPSWEQKLEAKLAQLRGGDAPKAATTTDAPTATDATTPTTTDATKTPQAAVTAPEPTSLERGCDAMRRGIGHYKRSMNSQAELKKAKAELRQAYTHLEAAHAEAQGRGDQAQASEIEGYLQQCNVYLEDCSKRETL
jgi:hypothetical protein